MTTEIIIATISGITSVLSAFCGILLSSRLTIYRISQLEEKVSKHNNLVERMVAVETSCKSAHKRIDEVKKEVCDE